MNSSGRPPRVRRSVRRVDQSGGSPVMSRPSPRPPERGLGELREPRRAVAAVIEDEEPPVFAHVGQQPLQRLRIVGGRRVDDLDRARAGASRLTAERARDPPARPSSRAARRRRDAEFACDGQRDGDVLAIHAGAPGSAAGRAGPHDAACHARRPPRRRRRAVRRLPAPGSRRAAPCSPGPRRHLPVGAHHVAVIGTDVRDDTDRRPDHVALARRAAAPGRWPCTRGRRPRRRVVAPRAGHQSCSRMLAGGPASRRAVPCRPGGSGGAPCPWSWPPCGGPTRAAPRQSAG